ncbi:hypothetical protein D3C75_1370270 [compost metagenome]
MAENDAEALADKLRLLGSMNEQGLQPVVTRARKKVETDFNQQLINRQLASLLHTLC